MISPIFSLFDFIRSLLRVIRVLRLFQILFHRSLFSKTRNIRDFIPLLCNFLFTSRQKNCRYWFSASFICRSSNQKSRTTSRKQYKIFYRQIFLAFTKTHDQAVLWEGKRGEKLKRCREKFHYSYFKRYWRYSQCLNSLKSQYLQVLAR